ncbi:hypothetical protein [Streptomyces sp. NPDC001380]|uniref:hypothetical protein n=1 Tax=Streptomyces sp. NPDC001380 TaxID=3364566 RepID=UPI0036BF900F
MLQDCPGQGACWSGKATPVGRVHHESTSPAKPYPPPAPAVPPERGGRLLPWLLPVLPLLAGLSWSTASWALVLAASVAAAQRVADRRHAAALERHRGAEAFALRYHGGGPQDGSDFRHCDGCALTIVRDALPDGGHRYRRIHPREFVRWARREGGNYPSG